MKQILLILLGLCANAALAANPITLSADNKNATFVVTLKANPTTGYQWSLLNYNKKLYTLVKKIYLRPDTKLIGAGGEMMFTFKLNSGKVYPQKSTFLFVYARPWEPQNSDNNQEVIVVFRKF